MNDLDRILAQRLDRRRFFRLAGLGGVSAAVLAACRRAETNGGGGGGPTGATGSTATRPSIEQEPGGLQVFDWSG